MSWEDLSATPATATPSVYRESSGSRRRRRRKFVNYGVVLLTAGGVAAGWLTCISWQGEGRHVPGEGRLSEGSAPVLNTAPRPAVDVAARPTP